MRRRYPDPEPLHGDWDVCWWPLDAARICGRPATKECHGYAGGKPIVLHVCWGHVEAGDRMMRSAL